MLSLKSWASACVESASRCRDGPKPPTACDVSSNSDEIFSLGSTSSPWLAAASTGPISAGTVPLVMVCPLAKYVPGLPADTRSRYCSPTADTECTLAVASIGTLYRSSILIVARAPRSVGSTSVTVPIVVPRYVTLALVYRPPESGRSAYNVYWPMPTSDGNRR